MIKHPCTANIDSAETETMRHRKIQRTKFQRWVENSQDNRELEEYLVAPGLNFIISYTQPLEWKVSIPFSFDSPEEYNGAVSHDDKLPACRCS